MATLVDSYQHRFDGPFVSADELGRAVFEGILSKNEARRVYYNQFPVLRSVDQFTPPKLGE